MKFWVAGLGVIVAAGLLSIPAANYYYKASWGAGCARCHEINDQVDSWRTATHRKINCIDCHDSSLATNLRRVRTHLAGDVPETVHMTLDDVFPMMEKCRTCHQQEYAQWSAGPHSATYERIFVDPEHNKKRPLMDDCLRCHGMHSSGGIRELVDPLDGKGPWRLKKAALASRPSMPCLACHSIHRAGVPLERPKVRATGGHQEIFRPSLALFDHRSQGFMSAAILPVPEMREGSRKVNMSPDRRQSLCYQCHAPLASLQVASGDDRTPIGVHEGLSCLACHQKHGQNTRASCADCHPRLSNCGRDVETMDTTFADPKSKHDIHFVKCADCHPRGVPARKQRAD